MLPLTPTAVLKPAAAMLDCASRGCLPTQPQLLSKDQSRRLACISQYRKRDMHCAAPLLQTQVHMFQTDN